MKRLFFLILCSGFFSSYAQWNNSSVVNTPVVTTPDGDNFPFSVPDGAGGSIVLFEKTGTQSDLYAQKINADGTIAWGSTTSPVAICTAASDQYRAVGIPDGSGGVFVCWYDFRFDFLRGEIYCQHLNSSGVPLWTANGIRVTETPGIDEYEPFLCSDGAGGVIVAWNWDNLTNNIQLNAQRIDASGTFLWPAGGVAVCTAAGFREGQGILPDGSNGAIITFTDSRNDPVTYLNFVDLVRVNSDVFAQRLSGTGVRLWGDNALPVCTAPGNQESYYLSSVVSDGAGGAVICYDDGRNDVPDANGDPTNMNIFAQRINSTGLPQWATNGIPVTTAVGNQTFFSMVADGSNGFVAAWNYEDAGRVYSQRINTAGSVLWAVNGISVSPAGTSCYDPVVVADGSGNYIYGYTATTSNSLDAQKLDINGSLLWGPTGIKVCNAANAQPTSHTLVGSDNGAVIFAWEDARTTANKYDLYASKVLANGSLAGAGTYITIANGNWNDPSIWQGGMVPAATSQVSVRHAVTVTGNASCYSLLVEAPGGNLTVNSGVALQVLH
jgi:hypothetical protein